MAKTAQHPVLVIMGVSGSGKSTVAGLLAGRLGWDLAEGDDLHPEVERGQDARRTAADRRGPVALAGKHRRLDPGPHRSREPRRRDVLGAEEALPGRPARRRGGFRVPRGSRDKISDRLASRHGHFMPPALLESQFDALEAPTAGRKLHFPVRLRHAGGGSPGNHRPTQSRRRRRQARAFRDRSNQGTHL